MTGILQSLLGSVSSAAAVATDAFFNLVTLLLPGNGTNGAQNNTFVDSSANNFSITRNGSATQGTFSPFSQTGWSVQFDRADYNNLLISSSSDFDFSSGDFTIEVWINPQSLPAAGDGSFHYIFATTNLVAFFFSGNIYFRNQATTELVTPVAHGMSQNVWYHLAFVRSGSGYAIYRNGSSISTGSGATVAAGASALTIAGSSGYNGITACTLSNFRITNGQALYTSTFTPATAPLTTTSQNATASNVKLLTCQSNRFVDNSTQNTKTINFGNGTTTLGNRSVEAFSPFLPTAAYSAANVGGSGYFTFGTNYVVMTNTSSSVTVPTSTTPFTIECWVYPTDSDVVTRYSAIAAENYAYVLGFGGSVGNYDATQTPWFGYFSGGWTGIRSTTTIRPNVWTHLACVFTGSTSYIYQNGVMTASGGPSTWGVTAGATKIRIGCRPDAGTDSYTGYISGARVTIGGNLYPSGTTFTPPTLPPTTTVSAGTAQFLMNFTNAGITDATAKNVFETVGGAQISTTQSKFGGSSVYFDGTGDALFLPPPQKELLRLGTGDFTIEFWAWKSANGASGYDTVISIGTDGNFTGGFSVELSNTRGFCFVYDAAVRISASLNPNDSTWHHYAVVRSGSTFSLYQDGTRLSTGTLTPTLGTNGNAYIGAGASSTGSTFNGYIDDLRVTRGYARYTGASYTVPTAAFALQ